MAFKLYKITYIAKQSKIKPTSHITVFVNAYFFIFVTCICVICVVYILCTLHLFVFCLFIFLCYLLAINYVTCIFVDNSIDSVCVCLSNSVTFVFATVGCIISIELYVSIANVLCILQLVYLFYLQLVLVLSNYMVILFVIFVVFC